MLDSLEAEHREARAVVVDALGDSRYLRLLDTLDGVEPKPGSGKAGASLADLWWDEFRRTRRSFGKLGRSPTDEELHAARIRVKRARYAAELGAGELGKPGERFVAAAKRLQDVLGEHQDAHVAESRIAAWAAEQPDPPELVARLLDSAARAPDSSPGGVAGRLGGAGEASPEDAAVIRAAGGLVVRESEDGLVVLVVHRPQYDDWSFPKGKASAGETDEACALREVEEETGLRCTLGAELPSTEYTDARGRPKRVRYWLMAPTGGSLAFEHEVDEAVWATTGEARVLLSYERDRQLLDALPDASPFRRANP